VAWAALLGAVPPAIAGQGAQWRGIAAPASPAEQARVIDGAELVLDPQSRPGHALSWHALYYTGDRIGDQVVGMVFDAHGAPIPDDSLGGRPAPFVSDTPDGTTLLRDAGGALYLITHFEYVTSTALGYATGNTEFGGPNSRYGRIPGVIGRARLARDAATGTLAVRDYRPLDAAPVHGVWMPCAASLSPWGTHLAGEEFEPDARVYALDTNPRATFMSAINDYYYPQYRGTRTVSPYHYGYIVEVSIEPGGAARMARHYSMGRRSNEVARVMPDRRTVYFGDDAPHGMLFMYLADTAGSLAKGTLYAARWTQRADPRDGGDLRWVRLGHASDAQLGALVARGVGFADIFAHDAGQPEIHAGWGRPERLAVKPGMEQAAAFLESRRYGALLGATAEFSKMEGVAVNAADRTLYLAISSIRGGMLASPGEAADHMRLPRNAAGAVFAATLAAGQHDSAGQPIDSAWVATGLRPIPELTGAEQPADSLGNRADPGRVANPDNLEYVAELRTLFVAEDSMDHLNNFLWAWPVDGGAPARILSVPAGAEVSALHWAGDVGGEGYLFVGYQHPGEWSHRVPSAVRRALQARIARGRGAVGYISGFGPRSAPAAPGGPGTDTPGG